MIRNSVEKLEKSIEETTKNSIAIFSKYTELLENYLMVEKEVDELNRQKELASSDLSLLKKECDRERKDASLATTTAQNKELELNNIIAALEDKNNNLVKTHAQKLRSAKSAFDLELNAVKEDSVRTRNELENEIREKAEFIQELQLKLESMTTKLNQVEHRAIENHNHAVSVGDKALAYQQDYERLEEQLKKCKKSKNQWKKIANS